MIAAQEKDKIRIVMDLSSQAGSSFNDNVDTNRLQKIHVAIAKHAGYAIVACGQGTFLWKLGMADA
jgi:hypothetical protein